MVEICLLVSLLTSDLSKTNSGPAPAPHQLYLTHSPGISLMPYSLLPPGSCTECFSPTRNWGHTKGMGQGVRPGFEFRLCYFLPVWHWAGYSNPLNLSFIICNMEGNSAIWPESCWKYVSKDLHWTNTRHRGTRRRHQRRAAFCVTVILPPRWIKPHLFQAVVPWLRQLSHHRVLKPVSHSI